MNTNNMNHQAIGMKLYNDLQTRVNAGYMFTFVNVSKDNSDAVKVWLEATYNLLVSVNRGILNDNVYLYNLPYKAG